ENPDGQILYGHRKVYSSCRLLLLSRFFVSRLRGFVCLTRVLEGNRRVLLACCMIALSMVLRGHPMSLGGVFMMLSCLVMRVFCHVDVLWNRYFDSLNPMQVMNHSSSHPLRPGLITPALPANFPARAWPYMVMWLSLLPLSPLSTHLFSFGPQSARAGGEVIHVDPIGRSSSVVPTGRRG